MAIFVTRYDGVQFRGNIGQFWSEYADLSQTWPSSIQSQGKALDSILSLIDKKKNVRLSDGNWCLYFVFIFCFKNHFFSGICGVLSALELSYLERADTEKVFSQGFNTLNKRKGIRCEGNLVFWGYWAFNLRPIHVGGH